MKLSRRPTLSLFLLCVLSSLLLSCGGNSTNCSVQGIVVNPANGLADHMALAPGNQVQFHAVPQVQAGCVENGMLPVLNWSTADPNDIVIGPSTGLATCVNSTLQAETITAALPDGSVKGNATLTCH